MNITGKVSLITGAASGIGRAAAALFAREGGRVMIADINADVGESAAEELRAIGGEVRFAKTDVTDACSVRAAVVATIAAFGRLDILYNNAGGSRPRDGRVTDTPEDEFWATIKIDLFGTWLGCKFGIPEMIKGGGGCIVNASSLVALIGYPGKDSYTAAKGAIAALTRSMAVEYASHKIRVNALAPGTTLTGRVAELVAQGSIPQSLLDRHLFGLLDPEVIAQAALFLASDASAGMTGQVVPIDGGASIS